MEHYFQYGQEEIDYLKSKDKKLARAIEKIGPIQREIIPDLFSALTKSIIGQQISSKAQATIWQRFLDAFGPLEPAKMAALSVEEIQAKGVSMRKASYIQGIAQAVVDGDLNLEGLQELSDEEVIQELVKLKGVGPWTAEMLMVFSMGRPNIISDKDLAIIRGLRVLYGHKEITPELFAKYKKRYSPYASVASLYLWELSHLDVE
jgi:DNA-3-methyladenine glycosylase II